MAKTIEFIFDKEKKKKTLQKKEKMLVTSIFSISHNIFDRPLCRHSEVTWYLEIGSVSDSGPGDCSFDIRFRSPLFPVIFRLLPLMDVREVVSGFG